MFVYIPEQYSCPEYGIDYSGYDIQTIYNVPNWKTCANYCANNPSCSFWTWKIFGFLGDEYVCWLKSSDSGRTKQCNISGSRFCLDD